MSSGGKDDLDRYYIATPQGTKRKNLAIQDYQEKSSGPYLQIVGWGN